MRIPSVRIAETLDSLCPEVEARLRSKVQPYEGMRLRIVPERFLIGNIAWNLGEVTPAH
jgi:hypothetical protein